MDWINLFANHGVPTIILGFILWFVIKPTFGAFLKNIEKQTEINQEIVDSCKAFKIELNEIKLDLTEIKKHIEYLIK